jgi:hypothetical protein
MKKHMLTLMATLGLMAALTSTTAFAQMLNMDMSWARRSQCSCNSGVRLLPGARPWPTTDTCCNYGRGDTLARHFQLEYSRHAAGFRAAPAAVNGCLPCIVRGQLRPDRQRHQQLGLPSRSRMPIVG